MVALATQKSSHAQKQVSRVSRASLGSWTLPAPAGAYSEIPAWHSAQAWFDAVLDMLATPEGEALRRSARVSRKTLLAVAHCDRMAADQSTGRGLATAHETVARELGLSSKTVQRARFLLEDFGLAVTVVEGRYLTAQERREAAAKHGGHQLRAASTRALTIPRQLAMRSSAGETKNVHLPSRRRVKTKTYSLEKSPTRAQAHARNADAPRRRAKKNQGHSPRLLEDQRFAAELVRRMSWLVRGGRHIGQLVGAIARRNLSARGWTPQQLLERIDRFAHDHSIRLSSPDKLRNPVGHLLWLLDMAIPATEPAPALVRARVHTQRVEAQRKADEARAARRALIASQSDEINEIIAQMHAQYPRVRRQ